MSDKERRCEELYRYRERLVAYVRGLVRPPVDAEEIVQIAIGRTCNNIANVAVGRELQYLRTTAHNLAINEATRAPRDEPIDTVYDTLTDKRRNPEEELIAREESMRFQKGVNAVMSGFSPDTRKMLVLRGNGMSTDAIARMLDKDPTAVRSRLSRAAKQLRERVGDPPQGLTWAELLGDNDDDQ